MATDEEKQTTTFKTLGICDELVDACQKLGWTVPTPIQVESMPSALDGSFTLSYFCISLLSHFLFFKYLLTFCPIGFSKFLSSIFTYRFCMYMSTDL